MSLLKVPFLITLAYAFYFSGSPPKSAALVSAPHKVVHEDIYELLLARLGPFLRNSMCIEIILETCALIWCSLPDSMAQRPLDACGQHEMTNYIYVAWALVALGTIIRRQCFSALGPMFTFRLTIQNDHKLVTTGPYSIVRHPGYAAFLLINFGVILLRMGSGGSTMLVHWMPFIAKSYNLLFSFLSVIASICLVARTNSEDIMLHNEFGDSWEAWVESVPYKCIPGIY